MYKIRNRKTEIMINLLYTNCTTTKILNKLLNAFRFLANMIWKGKLFQILVHVLSDFLPPK